MPTEPPRVWTVGHSNMEGDEFVSMLCAHDIDAVADVRSSPHSRHAPWFDRKILQADLRAARISYVWMGHELGGRPHDPDMYLPDGRVRYDRLAQSEVFAEGIERLREGMMRMRVAIMCSEENPGHCHRRLLIARVLMAHAVDVLHIRRGGGVEEDPGFVVRSGLFGDEELPWTSTASVSRRRRPSVSSAG